jgi:hypothetical protein
MHAAVCELCIPGFAAPADPDQSSGSQRRRGDLVSLTLVDAVGAAVCDPVEYGPLAIVDHHLHPLIVADREASKARDCA